MNLRTDDFDFDLPKKFIAQSPVFPRDHSKLMIIDSKNGKVYHKHFYDIYEVLNEDDVLVVNRSKVIPARILFKINGKQKEIFILKDFGGFKYKALVFPGKFFKEGRKFDLNESEGEVLEVLCDGSRIMQFDQDIAKYGMTPVPPYIDDKNTPMTDYQTVYAKEKGSVAAPTAGFHFTKDLLRELAGKGVDIEEVILHVGRGTFLPVSADKVEEHVMHSEFFEMPEKAADALDEAKRAGKRIVAVGTTSVRVLESCFEDGFAPKVAETDIFIYPGYKWKAVDCLITNFHLPKSTLVMLVASFLENKGVENPVEKILELYEIAKKEGYRFYSFGDSMMII